MLKITYVNSAKLKTLLKERGFTMKYFNDLLGKNRSYLSNVLTGSDSISDEELKIVADKLGTTVDYLTDKSEDKEKPTSTVSVDEVRKLIRQLPKEDLVKLAKEFIEILGE